MYVSEGQKARSSEISPRQRRRGQEFEARNRKPEVRGQEANARIPRLGSRGHSSEAGMLIYLEAEAGKPRPGPSETGRPIGSKSRTSRRLAKKSIS
jgi:hypothetical protein